MAPLKRKSLFLRFIENAQFSPLFHGTGFGLMVKTLGSHPAIPGSIPGAYLQLLTLKWI